MKKPVKSKKGKQSSTKPTDSSVPTGFHKAPTLLHSFGYAARGIATAFRLERNFRVHVFATAYVLYFSKYFSLTTAEYGVLMLAVGLVLVCELLNTAIEQVVDLTSPRYNTLAKVAKDVAAGAVFVSSLVSLVVGILLFWDPIIIRQVFDSILEKWYIFVPLFAGSTVIVFLPDARRFRHNHNKKDGTNQ